MVRFSLRLPTDLYAELTRRAHREHRSVNNQIVALLADALTGDWVTEDHEETKP